MKLIPQRFLIAIKHTGGGGFQSTPAYEQQRSHSLGIFVMPLSGDGVLLEQGRTPLLTFGFPLTRRLPLSFLQYELLIGGFGLVLVVDGSCHVLPQSAGLRRKNKALMKD